MKHFKSIYPLLHHFAAPVPTGTKGVTARLKFQMYLFVTPTDNPNRFGGHLPKWKRKNKNDETRIDAALPVQDCTQQKYSNKFRHSIQCNNKSILSFIIDSRNREYYSFNFELIISFLLWSLPGRSIPWATSRDLTGNKSDEKPIRTPLTRRQKKSRS
jgi:hypothetical protein